MNENKQICINKLKWLNENIVKDDYKLIIDTNARGFKRLCVLHLNNRLAESDITRGVSTYSDMIEVLTIFDFIYYLEPQVLGPQGKRFLKTPDEYQQEMFKK